MEDFTFLTGAWRGIGHVRGDEVTADITATAEPDGSIALLHITYREGAQDHRERIVIREHRGRTSAFIRAASGPEQRFQLESSTDGFRFTRADPKLGHLVWEIVPAGDGAFDERFTLGAGPARETVVTLHHVRA